MLHRVLAALVVVALTLAPASALVPGALAAPAAPGFRVKLLDSKDTFDSRDLMGKKVVVLRFQTSYCKPCVRESPAFASLVDRYRERGVEFLAVHIQDAAGDTRRFLKETKVSYPVAMDPRSTIGNRYGVKGTPYTVVIDRKGEIFARIVGESATTKLPRILDTALAQRRR